MTNIAAMAKAGINVDLRIERLEAMKTARIDRTETCFQGRGPHISYEELSKSMSNVDVLVEEELLMIEK